MKKPPKASVPISIRLDSDVAKRIYEASDQDYRTISATVTIALVEWLDRRDQTVALKPKVRAI